MSPRLAAALILLPSLTSAQPRSLRQDSTLDNLRHPPGTSTAPFGTLGAVAKVGTGPRTLILIPGIGFGGGVWREYMAANAARYTMYAVTLPGFGGTAPLPMPAPGVTYAEASWTASAVRAIEDLLETERLGRVTVVAHWALATQIGLELALRHPERVEALILVGGVLKSYYESTPAMLGWTAEQRARYAEGMGARWFRTVTRETWDDNNFMAYDYAINPRRGLFLWREAQAPALAVWIRYLLEFYAVDYEPRLAALRVPTLVVQPGFDDPGFYVEPDRNYMRNLCLESWRGAGSRPAALRFVTVPQSRLFVMFDQPEALDREVDAFLSRLR